MADARDQIEAAHRRAARIVEEAWRRAEELQEESLVELQHEVDRRLRDATASADRIRRAAARSAASDRQRVREELAAEAEAFWERTRREADAVLREARDAAVRVLAEATAEAARVRAEALVRADHGADRSDGPPTGPPPAELAAPSGDPPDEPTGAAGGAEGPEAGPTGSVRLLVLCTGNVRRSPVAEAFLRGALERVGVDAEVTSAGLLDEGLPAGTPVAEAVSGRGIDLSTHRSRRVTTEMLRTADLIIGMERAHVREVVVRLEEAFARTFTLRELVRRAEACGPRRPDEPLASWIARLHEGRALDDLLVPGVEDDVADPAGGSTRRAARTAREIDQLVDRFVAVGWGSTVRADARGADILPWAEDERGDNGRRGLLRRLLRR